MKQHVIVSAAIVIFLWCSQLYASSWHDNQYVLAREQLDNRGEVYLKVSLPCESLKALPCTVMNSAAI